MVGRGSRSAAKVSQRAYFRPTRTAPRRQIAEPRSSAWQCRGEWRVDKPGFLAPVQIAGCSSRWDFATRWERLGAPIGLATRVTSAMQGALRKSSFRSGASPHQRIGLATRITGVIRGALGKSCFHSEASPYQCCRR